MAIVPRIHNDAHTSKTTSGGTYGGGARRKTNNPRVHRNYEYIGGGYGGEMSLAAYNALIGIVLLFGFAANYFMVKYCTDYFMGWSNLKLTVIYFILVIVGIILSSASRNAFVSFIGYCMVVVPVGMILCRDIVFFKPELVSNAILLTGGIVLVMLIASTLFPRIFCSIGGGLAFALFAALAVELVLMIIGKGVPTLISGIFAVVFSLYIGYDWARAHEQYRSADAAVDACVSLYLDIVNVFMELLYLLGITDGDY